MTVFRTRKALWYMAMAKRTMLWAQRVLGKDNAMFTGECCHIREEIIELRQDVRRALGKES